MKKSILLLCLGFVSASVFAYTMTDFTNQPYISTNLKDYSSKDAKLLLGKMQGDTIQNSSKGARCIGPIAPKETGYYLFNELFWNENGVIHDCRATSIKIIFTDNSSVSFSGWANIKKHYQEFFFDDRNPDYAE